MWTKEEARAERLANAPQTMRGHYRRAWSGKSRSEGVVAFCVECMGFERCAVPDCKSYACPLWEYRPLFSDKDECHG